MAFNMKGPSLYKKPVGPRADNKGLKVKKTRTNKEILDAIDKEETIGTKIDEGSIESQAQRRKENNKK